MSTISSQNPITVVTIATPGPRGPVGPPAPSGDISGSLELSGSLLLTGSLITSGSFVDFSDATYVTGSFTGSFVGDGSGITGITASIANSSSFAVVTGPNQFTGSQFVTGSIIPEAVNSGNGLHDLGSVTKPWRDLYITTSSLNFVKDAVVIASMNGEPGGVRIGNIFIGTSSISVVSGSGDNMTTISNVVEVTTNDSGSVEKVIEQYVTASGDASITGSLTVSGSNITVLGGTFVGDGSGLTGITASLPSGVISSSTQLDNLGYVESSITSSTIITSSVNLNEITFTKGDSSTFSITVDTGSGEPLPSGVISSSAQVIESLPSGVISGSSQLPSGLISGSEQLPSGIISSSSQLPLGIISGSEQLPLGLISSSTQLNDLGYVESSITSSTIITSSANLNVITFTKGDSSTFSITVDTGSGEPLPSGVISSSAQVIESLPSGIISSSSQLPSGLISGSEQLPSGLISSSDQLISELPSGVVSSSVQTISNLPSGVISGSTQINELGFINSTITSSMSVLNAETSSIANSLKTGLNLEVNQITGSSASFISMSVGYLESITGSAKTIGDAFIILNNETPTNRYAGLKVIDSGSANTTSSFEYDGLNDNWFHEKEVGGNAEYGIALFGPQYGVKDSPTYLTSGVLPKSNGNHHLVDSNITDNGNEVIISTTTIISGSLLVSGSGMSGSFSGSFVGNGSGLTNLNIDPTTLPSGLVSSSTQTIANLPSGVISGSEQLPPGIISSSAQIISELPSSTISSSAQITELGYVQSSITASSLETASANLNEITFTKGDSSTFSITVDTGSLPSGVISSSAQVIESLPLGVISGSEQLPSGIISSSTQLPSGIVSSSTQTISNLPLGTVSGSSQVLFSGISGLPPGIVSSSAQTLSNLPLGTISSSTQLTELGYVQSSITASSLETASVNLNEITFTKGDSSTFSITIDTGSLPSGVISGSEQLPSGIISGSSQLESLGVSVASGGSTTFDNNVEIDGGLFTTVITPNLQNAGFPFYTLDCSKGNFFEVTLPSNQTGIRPVPTNANPGQTINFKITQNSTTASTLNWASVFNFADGFDSAVSTGLGDIDVFSFTTYNGNDWYATGLKNFS